MFLFHRYCLGVKPNPGSWKHWNLKRLEPKPPRSEDAAKAIMGGKRGAEEGTGIFEQFK